VHCGAIPPAEAHLFTLARPGYRYTLISENNRPTPLERGLAHKALVAAFSPKDCEWVNAMLNTATPLSVNRGQIVVRLNDHTRDLFVVLSGELAVYAEVNGAIATLARIGANEVFGEMAMITGAPRCATVMATTAARLLRIPARVYERFATATDLRSSLPQVWQKRAELERVGIFSKASTSLKNELARCATRRTIQPGSTLIREGSPSSTVYVLVAGRVQVFRGESPLLVNATPVILEPGSIIGETAPFLKQARNASIVTVDECQVLAIRGEDFKRIVKAAPQLFCRISSIVRERQAA
jgi:CRP-like cAMP-binding protein